jgi:flagellar basal body rod protein FlgG
MVELGKLRLESYPAPGFLEFEGHLAYPTERAGPARELRPGATEMSQVRQGTQEGSNVELPRAISDFRDKNSQVSTLAQLLRLLNGSQRQFIQNISQSIG